MKNLNKLALVQKIKTKICLDLIENNNLKLIEYPLIKEWDTTSKRKITFENGVNKKIYEFVDDYDYFVNDIIKSLNVNEPGFFGFTNKIFPDFKVNNKLPEIRQTLDICFKFKLADLQQQEFVDKRIFDLVHRFNLIVSEVCGQEGVVFKLIKLSKKEFDAMLLSKLTTRRFDSTIEKLMKQYDGLLCLTNSIDFTSNILYKPIDNNNNWIKVISKNAKDKVLELFNYCLDFENSILKVVINWEQLMYYYLNDDTVFKTTLIGETNE